MNFQLSKTLFYITFLAACILFSAGCRSVKENTADAGVDLDSGGKRMDAGNIPDAGDSDSSDPVCSDHVFEDVMIPMRDGKKLAAFARRPEESGCRLPVILVQTPYDKENFRDLYFGENAGEHPLFSDMSYAFVVVDWRGFFASMDAAEPGVQPSYEDDGYDSVEWAAAQEWSDGNVGTWGVSALCGQQYKTAVLNPPHMKAAVPIFCAMNISYGQYYPGGVLRKEYMDFIDSYYGGGVVKDHPYNDAVWDYAGKLYRHADVQVPMLVVAGWFDLYNKGTLFDFMKLKGESDQSVQEKHRLLAGDWIHFATGGESGGAGRPFNEQELKYVDTGYIIQEQSVKFFDLHLKGKESEAAGWAPVRYIRAGDKEWGEADTWPPEGLASREYVLNADGTLTVSSGPAGELSFTYDPEDPSPTRGGSTLMPDMLHGPMDQKDVLERNDNVVFTTAPLEQDLVVLGEIRIDLLVKTTAEDTDFAARLTDVDEDGVHLLLNEGIQRLKLRESFSRVSEVVPGTAYEISIVCPNEIAYKFPRGHRIGLIITSSNYERFDRNQNNGNNFYDEDDTSVVARNTLVLNGKSKLILSIDD